MNRKLKTALEALSDLEFRKLDLAIQLAKQARSIRERFKLSDLQCYELLGIEPGRIRAYMNGAYEYTISDMAYQQATFHQLETDLAADKIEAQTKQMVHVIGLEE